MAKGAGEITCKKLLITLVIMIILGFVIYITDAPMYYPVDDNIETITCE